MIATSSYDKTAKIWSAQTGEEIRTLIGHSVWVESAAFSPDGKRVVTAAGSAAKIWDAETGIELTTLFRHTGVVSSAEFSQDGKHIVTASWDGTAIIWDAMAKASSWTQDELRENGCKRIVLQGLAEFGEPSPILAGGAPDGARLKSPCDKRGLKSWAWWKPHIARIVAPARKLLSAARRTTAGDDPPELEAASSVP